MSYAKDVAELRAKYGKYFELDPIRLDSLYIVGQLYKVKHSIYGVFAGTLLGTYNNGGYLFFRVEKGNAQFKINKEVEYLRPVQKGEVKCIALAYCHYIKEREE